MPKKQDFDPTVPLPPGLTVGHIKAAIGYLERELADWVEIYVEQSNVFSALVGIMGTKALDQVSSYEKHRNVDTAQQRFPDPRRRGSGANPKPIDCLESKGSKRIWDIQAHYDHSGWYIVWRYLVDATETLETGRPVIIWRVDVIFLGKADWKYEKSGAGHAGGGRTHTFAVRFPAKKLRGKAVYKRCDVEVKNNKPVVKILE